MFYKVNVYSKLEDRGVLIWKWKKHFLGAWVESRREFDSCDTCISNALADAKGQRIHLEADRCSLYRYALDGRLHQYGSCFARDDNEREMVLDVIAQIEDRHNLIVLKDGQPFFSHYRDDYSHTRQLMLEMRQDSGEWLPFSGSFTYVLNNRSQMFDTGK